MANCMALLSKTVLTFLPTAIVSSILLFKSVEMSISNVFLVLSGRNRSLVGRMYNRRLLPGLSDVKAIGTILFKQGLTILIAAFHG